MRKHIDRPASIASLLVLAVLLSSSSASTPAGQPPQQQSSELSEYIKAHYTKREAMVPMRDGAKLFARTVQ